MAASKVKCEIFQAANNEWTFHLKRGSRIILVPGETYSTHAHARRAVMRLRDIASVTDNDMHSAIYTAACAALAADSVRAS